MPIPPWRPTIASAWKRSDVNTPFEDDVVALDEWIRVEDPTHPLCGRRYRVAHWPRVDPGANKDPAVRVWDSKNRQRRIPLSAFRPPTKTKFQVRTKVNLAAVDDLVRTVQTFTHDNPSESTVADSRQECTRGNRKTPGTSDSGGHR